MGRNSYLGGCTVLSPYKRERDDGWEPESIVKAVMRAKGGGKKKKPQQKKNKLGQTSSTGNRKSPPQNTAVKKKPKQKKKKPGQIGSTSGRPAKIGVFAEPVKTASSPNGKRGKVRSVKAAAAKKAPPAWKRKISTALNRYAKNCALQTRKREKWNPPPFDVFNYYRGNMVLIRKAVKQTAGYSSFAFKPKTEGANRRSAKPKLVRKTAGSAKVPSTAKRAKTP